MQEQLRFRLAENTKQDAEQFCALSNSLYARPVNEKYYYWQFFECPFPSLLNVAVDENGKIVGTYGLHVQNASPPSANVVWVLDIMVSPQIQRHGVFRKLVEFGFEQLQPYNPAAITVMANENADRACTRGLEWKRINTFFTCFAKPDESHKRKKFLLEYEKINDFSSCSRIFEANGISLFSNARTIDYQNWRFVKNARYDYEIFLAHKNAQPFGYIVLKIFRDPVSSQSFGDIVDILWIENDREALTDLLKFSLAYFYRQNVGSSAIWLQTNTVIDEIGTEVGFKRSDQQRFFCGKALREDFGFLENAGNWFINMSDSEIY